MSRFLTGLFAALALLISGVPAAAQSIGYSPNTLPLSGSCGVVTVSTPCLDLSQTWNNAGAPFTGLKLNVTDTASAVGSLLMDLQVDGVSKFRVGKGGGLISSAGVYHYLGGLSSTAITTPSDGSVRISNSAGTNIFDLTASGSGLATLSGGLTAAGGITSTSGDFTAPSGGQLIFANRGVMSSPADATFRLRNNAGTITTDITLSGASGVGGSTATFGGSIVSGGNVQAVSAGGFSWLGGKGGITQATDGVYTFANNAGSNSVALTVGASNLLSLNGGLTLVGQLTPGGISPAATGTSISIGNAGFLQFGSGSGGAARGFLDAPSDGSFRLHNGGDTNSVTLTVGASNLLTLNGGLTIGGTFLGAGNVRAGAGSYFYFNGGSQIGSPADGNVLLQNSGGSTFGLLQFGGTTSSFPALKRVTNTVQARLADDSGFATIVAAKFTLGSGTIIASPSNGITQLTNAAETDFTRLILGTNDTSGIAIKKNGTSFSFVLGDDTGDAAITSSKVTTSATDFLHNTSAALANGAAAQVATMTNGPTAGNPTKWIAINDNGTTRYIPAW